MAEFQDKQEEEKPGPTPEPKAASYISLDQARALALQHAQDNRGLYGRRYARQDLAWEVLSQEERPDYYDIRLAYRPAGGFRGTPGVERFTITKTGSILLRSVVQRPVEPRTLLVPSALAAALLIAGGVAASLFAAGIFSGDSPEAVSLTAGTPLRD